MKTAFVLGLLSRSLLLVSFSSLLACSWVLQASRLSKSYPQQPAEQVTDAPPEPLQDAEATYGSPIPTTWGYQWVFIIKEGPKNSPSVGYWVKMPPI